MWGSMWGANVPDLMKADLRETVAVNADAKGTREGADRSEIMSDLKGKRSEFWHNGRRSRISCVHNKHKSTAVWGEGFERVFIPREHHVGDRRRR